MSDTIAGIPPPYRGRYPAPTITSLEIVAQSLSLLRRSLSTRWDIWLVAVIFLVGTNIAGIGFAPMGDRPHASLSTASQIVRAVSYIPVAAAAVRAFTGRGSVWSIDLPLLRYMAATLAALLALLIPMFFIIALAAFGTKAASAVSMAVFVGCILVLALVMLRVSPWLAALSVGDGSLHLSSAWKGMRGAMLAAVGAAIWLSPVLIVHIALNAEAQYQTGTAQLAFTIVDGLVCVLQLMIDMAIIAVLYLFVRTHMAHAPDHFPA